MDRKDYYRRLKWGAVASLFAATLVTFMSLFLLAHFMDIAGAKVALDDFWKVNIILPAFLTAYVIFFC